MEEPVPLEELPLELAGCPAGEAKAEVDVGAISGLHRLFKERDISAEVGSRADFESLLGKGI